MTAADLVQQLRMENHPEGGYFKQTYRSPNTIATPNGERRYSTAIYYLLEQGDFSAFHRLKSDECWHFYAGDTLLIHIIGQDENYYCVQLGPNLHKGDHFQYVVPAGVWFAAEPAPRSPFTLVGCTVAPGFEYEDSEMPGKEILVREFPQHEALIRRLAR